MAVTTNGCGCGSYLVPLALFALAGSASAAGVTYETTYVGGGRYVPNGISAAGTLATNGPWGTKYHPIAATLPKAAFGTVARGMLRGGVYGAAIQAAIEGAGYLADQYTGEVQSVTEVEVQYSEQKLAPDQTKRGYNLSSYAYAMEQCQAQLSLNNTTECRVMPYSQGYNPWQWVAAGCYEWNGKFLWWEGNTPYCTTLPITTQTTYEYAPATAQQLQEVDDYVWEQLSDRQKLAIAESYLRSLSPQGQTTTEAYPLQSLSTSNPALQQGYATWPELEAALVSTLNGQMAAYMASTDPTFEATPEEQAVAEQATDTAPIEQAPEWPAFCDWAPFICEPFAGGEQPPVPRMDFDVPEYDSGLPTMAACPAPVQLSLGAWGSQEISLTPACDVASAIRGPLLALSYLIAAFIVVGVRR